jgi:hypothetical protein
VRPVVERVTDNSAVNHVVADMEAGTLEVCAHGAFYDQPQVKCNAEVPDEWQAKSVGPLVVFIMYEKVGSNSLRHSLEQIAAGRLDNSRRLAYYCKIQNGEFLNSSSPLCNQHGLPTGCCAGAPSGTIVIDNRYGFCSHVHGRPCSYVTVLREPIARYLSAYNYMCVACADNNANCPAEPRPDSICPRLNVTSFIEHHVQKPRAGVPSYIYAFGRGTSPGERLPTALARLRQTTAMALEGLAAPDGSGWRRFQSFFAAAPRTAAQLMDHNSIEHTQRGSRAGPLEAYRTVESLTTAERASLESTLADDLALYNEMVQMSGQAPPTGRLLGWTAQRSRPGANKVNLEAALEGFDLDGLLERLESDLAITPPST